MSAVAPVLPAYAVDEVTAPCWNDMVGGTSVSVLVAIVIAILVLASVWSPASAQEMRCNEMPFVVDLPKFEVACFRLPPASYEEARAEAAKGPPWMLDFLEATSPQYADSYVAMLNRDGKEIAGEEIGNVTMSIADQKHGLATVDARKAAEATIRLGDQMFSDKTTFTWFSPSTLGDYNIQEYSLDTKSSFLPTAPRSCFTFARHTGRSTDGKYRNRLWGFYCRVESERLDQATMKRVLSAISTR